MATSSGSDRFRETTAISPKADNEGRFHGLCDLSASGAGGETRTHTSLRRTAFESNAVDHNYLLYMLFFSQKL